MSCSRALLALVTLLAAVSFHEYAPRHDPEDDNAGDDDSPLAAPDMECFSTVGSWPGGSPRTAIDSA
jgi:hypothetical protein